MELDVIVIGSGQAGLAAGYYLKRNHANFLILGKEKRVGDSWRNRYDSLILFTPRAYSSLPGFSLNGEQDGYATKNEIADYLERYVKHFELPVQLNVEVQSFTKDHGNFRIQTNSGEYIARKVIVATGPFQKPWIPKFASFLSEDVHQVHTSEYLNPLSLKEGPVLVIGAGNSGAQIAVELAKEREVYLSFGHKLKFFPLQAFGKSIFWWFDKLGVLKASISSSFGRFISKQSDPIFGFELKKLISEGKINIKPRTESIDSHFVHFEDGSHVEVQNVVWATGFHSDYNWIHIPHILNERGKPIHERGVSIIEGLYFLGLPWQYRRGSALIGGVGEDAKFIIEFID